MYLPELPLNNPMYWVALVASAILLALTLFLKLDHTDDWMNRLRRSLLPIFHRIGQSIGDLYAVRPVGQKEFAMLLGLGPDLTEKRLEKLGLEPNIASSLKETEDGRFEVGSFAYRESIHPLIPNFLAIRQIHVMVFNAQEGTELYVHGEYSSILPIVGLLHYRGITYSDTEGIEKFTEMWTNQYGTDEIIRS